MDIIYKKAFKEWSEHWFQFILDNLYEGWDFDELCLNPNVTWDIVRQHPDWPWDYEELSFNPNITWDIVTSNPDIKWNFDNLSSNPNITWEIVKANPDISWNYGLLSSNVSGTILYRFSFNQL